MYFAKSYLLIELVLWLLCFKTEGQKVCSCYTFGDGKETLHNCETAKNSCRNNTHLVVMETEREWQFITNEIRKRNIKYNEWHIGLILNKTSGNWTWINGKPLTLNKWHGSEPNSGDVCGLIHKNFPTGYYGSFSANDGEVLRKWICEEETDNCEGVCLRHYNVTTTTTPPPTKPPKTTLSSPTDANTATRESTSAASRGYTAAAGRNGENSNSTIVVVAASLGALLFIALIALAVVLFLRRKKRRSHEADELIKNKLSSQPESQYEPVNPTEAAKLLGTKDSANVHPKNKQAEYAMVNKKDKEKPTEHDMTQEPPEMTHDYAAVDKTKKKKKEGDLVYAEVDVAELDNSWNESEVHKPSSYEPTVYADVLVNALDPDSNQPTYSNVQTTGV